MRVRVFETDTIFKDYFSMREAEVAYGKSIRTIKKLFKVKRIYEEGYWNNVDAEYLKAIAVARYGFRIKN
jgi:hypothetical protein